MSASASSSASDPIWVHSRPIKVVAIVGGTHGNEANGVALARHLIRHPELASRPSFETRCMLHNLEAIKRNVRYVEEDLNRCYYAKDLMDSSLSTLEAKRAKEMNALLGPKSSAQPAVDLIIDLHNTTASTGVALMMPPKDELSHAIGAHLISHDATVRVVNWAAGKPDYPMLPTVARHGMTFEVGAAPWGVIDGASYVQSLGLIMRALDYVHAHNLAIAAGASGAWKRTTVPVYEALRSVDYPRYEDGTLSAMIHPSLQGHDFSELHKGDPAFLTMSGQTLGFEPSADEAASGLPTYPFFINEAAYYEKGIAFMTCQMSDQPIRLLEHVPTLTPAEAEQPETKRQKS